MRNAVGENQSVVVEVFVVCIVLAAHVAAISPVFTPCFVGYFKSLIYPVPYETALHIFASTDNVPVFFEVASTVAHGMCIFAHDKRTVHLFAGCITFHITNPRIHTVSYTHLRAHETDSYLV